MAHGNGVKSSTLQWIPLISAVIFRGCEGRIRAELKRVRWAVNKPDSCVLYGYFVPKASPSAVQWCYLGVLPWVELFTQLVTSPSWPAWVYLSLSQLVCAEQALNLFRLQLFASPCFDLRTKTSPCYSKKFPIFTTNMARVSLVHSWPASGLQA